MKNPIIRFLYLAWYLPILVGGTIVLGLLCFVVSYFSPRAARHISNNWWGHLVLNPAGIRLKVYGLESLPQGQGGFIIYANHSSLLDIPTVALATQKPLSWIAKASLGRIPFFGWALARVHMLVDRGGSAEAARKMVDEAIRRLNLGEILSIFPEGTRNRSGEPVLPFKKGAFILAKHTGVPIVPVAIKNAGSLWPANGYWPTPGLIRVKIGQPFLPLEGEKLGQITARAQGFLHDLLVDDSW